MASPRQFRLAADAEDVHPSFQSFSRSDRSFPELDDDGRNALTTQRLFVRASIECRVETNWGDTVVVCGSTEQLGSWKPDRALRMATDETIYPVWRCEPLLLCSDAIEFKFVILRAGGPAEWEPLPHNRPLPLSELVQNGGVKAAQSGDAESHAQSGPTRPLGIDPCREAGVFVLQHVNEVSKSILQSAKA